MLEKRQCLLAQRRGSDVLKLPESRGHYSRFDHLSFPQVENKVLSP
jgi:hypothetical protein